jgi:hypothetical protein
LKHATPKKKAGSVHVSRTIATAVIATAAAGVATPAVATELPQPHHDVAEAAALPETPALPEALAETTLPASIPPVQHVAPDYSLPGFSGQGDIGPGVRATTEGTDVVDGMAGQVDALSTGQAAGIGRSADLTGGLGGAVDTATALVR